MPSPNPPSQYISFAAPDVLSDKVRSFLADFYSISDTPNVHETYADQFSDDAEIVMGANTVKGREEIVGLRNKMWSAVQSRSHIVSSVYPFSSEGSELMLHGTVDYVMKEGGEKKRVEWAARMIFKEGEEGKKIQYYRVWL